MGLNELVKKWFAIWENGDYLNLPISENFKHTSPYGTINGKKEYLQIVASNKDKFLGHRMEIHNEIYEKTVACVRYTAIQDNFSLDVSEWYFLGKQNLIEEIVAYYNIEEERIKIN